jgi:hypothetical protein
MFRKEGKERPCPVKKLDTATKTKEVLPVKNPSATAHRSQRFKLLRMGARS